MSWGMKKGMKQYHTTLDNCEAESDKKRIACEICKKEKTESECTRIDIDIETHFFCSDNCARKWLIKRLTVAIGLVALGLIVGLLISIDEGNAVFLLICTFLPYSIRLIVKTFGEAKTTFGEFLSGGAVILLSVTVIFPLVKFIMECKQCFDNLHHLSPENEDDNCVSNEKCVENKKTDITEIINSSVESVKNSGFLRKLNDFVNSKPADNSIIIKKTDNKEIPLKHRNENKHPGEKQKPNEVICPVCKQSVASGYQYCPHCGNKISVENQNENNQSKLKQSASDETICPVCQHSVAAGYRFCLHCGNKIS